MYQQNNGFNQSDENNGLVRGATADQASLNGKGNLKPIINASAGSTKINK